MHEALHHAVREVKTYFPYDSISATQVGFDRVQIIMPEAALDDLVHMLKNSEDTPGLRDDVKRADILIADLENEVTSLRASLASARRQMDYWMDELESNDIEVRPPRV